MTRSVQQVQRMPAVSKRVWFSHTIQDHSSLFSKGASDDKTRQISFKSGSDQCSCLWAENSCFFGPTGLPIVCVGRTLRFRLSQGTASLLAVERNIPWGITRAPSGLIFPCPWLNSWPVDAFSLFLSSGFQSTLSLSSWPCSVGLFHINYFGSLSIYKPPLLARSFPDRSTTFPSSTAHPTDTASPRLASLNN